MFDFQPAPLRETKEQKVKRAKKWIASDLPRRRREGLTLLCAEAPDEALEPLFTYLSDPDLEVRRAAFVGLLGYGVPPRAHGERIVKAFGGEASAAQEWVRVGYGPQTIGWFGLTDRLLPQLDEISHDGKRWLDRRRATKYAAELRRHPPGWPVDA
jgi:hypothetical protein